MAHDSITGCQHSYAEPCISYGRVVSLSIRLSHAGKLESQNLHRRITQGLYSLGDKKFIQKFERVQPQRGH